VYLYVARPKEMFREEEQIYNKCIVIIIQISYVVRSRHSRQSPCPSVIRNPNSFSIWKDIQSNKYLAGNFKNLYSDHRSLFLRIPTDKNVIPLSPPIHDNTWQSWQSYTLIFLLCQNRIMLFIVLFFTKYIDSFIY